MKLHHVLPLALAANAAQAGTEQQRSREKFARRRMRQRRPIPIAAAMARPAILVLIVAAAVLACEKGPAATPPEHTHDPPATAAIKTVILTVGDRPFRQSGSGSAAASHAVPEITQAVIDDGSVIAHVKMSGSDSTWWPTPFSIIARSASVEITCAFTEGTAMVFITGTIVTPRIIDLFRGFKIRLTIIPPGGLVQ